MLFDTSKRLMAILVLINSFAAQASSDRGTESIDQVIRANIGTARGIQTDPNHGCQFEVSETQPEHFLLMLTFGHPNRMLGAHYSGDSRFFWFDSTAHTITFDRTAIGRGNVIYTYDPESLKFVSVEEEGEDLCKLSSQGL